ncbi:MAG: PQQ-like beta-propeller repeat protein [Pirellulaceae bacterium]|nr:PQQ-like beta-propeller repeat protein [Pirellulaceae bacterium]
MCLSACAWLSWSTLVPAADWSRFRGPNGSGISTDAHELPSEFSPTKNLQWKGPLPGPGSSSPIVVGNRVLVTCWTGYGVSREEPGDMKALKLHLLCFDRNTGKQLWDRSVDPYYPEEEYSGMFAEHGYASHTPASDGERVYVFFGKAGIHAFDMEGKPLWNKSVGTGIGFRNWGTSSSPVLYKDLVIVTAAAESQALVAFNKRTGEQVWKQEADGLTGTWGTPVLVEVDSSRTDLVIGVPFEIWGINPDTGKLRWYCEASQDESFCSSVVASGDTVYAIEGRSGGAFAVRAGGKDDVTKTHMVWSGSNRNRIGTPVVVDGKLLYMYSKVINCVDAKTGAEIYQGRLTAKPGSAPAGAPADAGAGQPRGPGGFGGFGGGRGGRGGGMGGMGGQDYSSPVVGDGKLYYVARNGDIYVLQLGSSFKQLSVNRLTEETEDFSGSPAISDKQIFIRSSKHLYSVSQ